MSREDEEEEVETKNSPNDDLEIESTVLLDDVCNATSTANKRKRSGLDISVASSAVLPAWVAGKTLQ